MIAVTGAGGFLGSAVVWGLNQRGERHILCVDTDLSAHRYANLKPLHYSAYLCHDEFLGAMGRGAYKGRLAAVIHLGACSSTTETNWDYLLRNNVEYTRSLWRWCAANGAPLLYASSAATYGDGSRGFDDRTPPSALTPLNLYGKSKNDFDAWALAEVENGEPAPPKWAGSIA